MHKRKQKTIEEVKQDPNDIIGTYAAGKGDYGFIDIVDRDKGFFVFGRNSLNAMPGDKVLASVKEFKGKQEAVVKKILERRQDPIVGIFNVPSKAVQEGGRSAFGFVVPNDPNLKNDIFIPGKRSMNAKPGEVVAVKVTRWEGRSPEGEVIKVLGEQGAKGVDIMALALEYGARIGFGEVIIKELAQLSKKVSAHDRKVRTDLTQQLTITIDGADSKDLDDAISLKVLPKGNYILSVHIADVAHYVKEDHAIDKEARRRGTSIYLVDKVIPMLPKELSNGLCSLNPNEEKLTLTCDIEINQSGHIVDTKVYESIIKSDFRMTYKEVDEILEEKILLGDALMFGGNISEGLKNMIFLSEDLRKILAAYKKELGVLEFDFPETKIIVDDQGHPIEFKRYERYKSGKIIEEFMIMANEAVSRKFSKLPFLYRTHPKPSEEDIDKLYKSLAIFSYNVPLLSEIKSKDIQRILDEIKNDKKEKLLSKMVLRSLTKAIYSENREGHFGLALDYYSHFTSPIRRYPDLMIHRIIKDSIHMKLDKERLNSLKLKLPNIAKKCSESEIKSEKLEYKVRDLMGCKFMKDKIGDRFVATVSGVIGKGVFVELENTIEGFVELNSAFGRSDYELDQDLMLIKNTITRQTFTIGDSVNVELKKVDEKLMRIDFELVESFDKN